MLCSVRTPFESVFTCKTLVFEIFHYLAPSAVVACRQICKIWMNFIEEYISMDHFVLDFSVKAWAEFWMKYARDTLAQAHFRNVRNVVLGNYRWYLHYSEVDVNQLIGSLNFPNLKYLNVVNLRNLTDSAFQNQSFENLQQLDLGRCAKLGDATLKALCTNNISRLSIKGTVITDRGFQQYGLFRNLVFLDISFCRKIINSSSFEHISLCTKLRQLNACSSHITNQAVEKILTSCNDLNWLELARCVHLKDDAGIRAIASRKQWKVLVVRELNCSTNFFIQLFACSSTLTSLDKLDVRSCQAPTLYFREQLDLFKEKFPDCHLLIA